MGKLKDKFQDFCHSRAKAHFAAHELSKIPRWFRWRAVTRWVERSDWQYALNTTEARSEKIVVSLTTFPPRYQSVQTTLKSLALQEQKADKIVVWIWEKDSFLPELKELEQYGIEFFRMPNNLRAHNKYFFSTQQYPDCCVITVDDDIAYPADTIKTLIQAHQKYPQAVCARRVHKILRAQNGQPLPYNEWPNDWTGERQPSKDLIALGVGGVLYPPHALPKQTFSMEDVQTLCPKADDLWLKAMENLAQIPVVWVPCRLPLPPSISGSEQTGLYKENVLQGGNDIQLQAIGQKYPEAWQP